MPPDPKCRAAITGAAPAQPRRNHRALSLGATFLAGLVAAMAAGEAVARPDTRSLTCRGVQDLVKKNGSVTLATGANTYDRFVVNSHQCGIQGRAANTFVPTSDNPNCRLQTCRGRRSSDGSR